MRVMEWAVGSQGYFRLRGQSQPLFSLFLGDIWLIFPLKIAAFEDPAYGVSDDG